MNDQQKEMQLFTHAFKFAAIGMALVSPDGRWLKVNRALCCIVGYSEEELLQMSFQTITHPDDLDRDLNFVRQMMNDELETYQVEKRYFHKSGRVVWVLLSVSLVRDGKNSPLYFISQIQDISEKKKIEKSQRHLIAILEETTDFVATGDKYGNVLYYNSAARKMLGISDDEDISRIIIPQTHTPWAAELVMNTALPYAEKHGVWSGETELLSRNGEEIPVLQVIIAHREQNGDIEYFSTIARDIRKLKKTEEILSKTDRLAALGQLAAGVAHEIRNPLTTLRGFIQIFLAKDASNKEYLDIMLSELDRINLIVSELLMLAKPQAANFQVKDLKVLVRNVITLLQTQAILHNVQMIAQFDEEPLCVKCEENHLKQVFINIIQNAVEAMSEGGDLAIEVKKHDDGNALIRFADQGCGIPEDRLSKLGEPFYSTKEKGFGLGLMVSYKIIKEHRGTIHVKSLMGQGTTFDVFLPVCETRST
ncbi:PAS domain-containing sensor histidine kinase [Ferviditalea candida]|uniref:histidine kinase n=1 Tax=Ferviditalea candida TaxID=3108399 RepID=A0ABU5ZDU3_9BACL|nr:PAS domain S-box protein [Paenibacillaceae bacterium T2]